MVCDFCHEHLEANKQAYTDPRLHLIYNDAREELECYEGKFDVIIGDLADPVDGGPCYQVMCLAQCFVFLAGEGRSPGGNQTWHAAVRESHPCPETSSMKMAREASCSHKCQHRACCRAVVEAHTLCVPAAAALYAGLL